MIVSVEMPSGSRSRGYRCGEGSRKEQDRDATKWFKMVITQMQGMSIDGSAVLLTDGETELQRHYTGKDENGVY